MHVRNTLLALVALGFLVLTLGADAPRAVAPDAPAAIDPNLAKRLEEIDARRAKVKDFSGTFEQRKFTALLKKPLVSGGTVRVKGNKVRWDTERPEPVVLFTDGREIRIYYPNQKVVEVYPIDRRLSELAASPLPRLATLRELFTIEQIPLEGFADAGANPDAQLALRMVPKDDALKQHVKQVRVLLDVGAVHILKVETTDADEEDADAEERTLITFGDVKLNAGLADADVDLVVPPDTKVSRPLDAVEGRGEGGADGK